jgi:hypothetical protein
MRFSTIVGTATFLVVSERGEEKHQHAEQPDDAPGDRDRDQQR